MKKILTLDIKKWKCGSEYTEYGKGDTCLKNRNGFMCCLGQFSEQLDKKCDIFNRSMPRDAIYTIPIDNNPLMTLHSYSSDSDSPLSSECQQINDEQRTTVLEKIQKLSNALTKYGLKLKVVNYKLFDSRGNFIGKELVANEWYDTDELEDRSKTLSDWVNGYVETRNIRKTAVFTSRLIQRVGVVRAKKLIKAHVIPLLENN